MLQTSRVSECFRHLEYCIKEMRKRRWLGVVTTTERDAVMQRDTATKCCAMMHPPEAASEACERSSENP
jgi:hypothetical protein